MVWDLEGKRKESLKTFTDDDLASELERRQREKARAVREREMESLEKDENENNMRNV